MKTSLRRSAVVLLMALSAWAFSTDARGDSILLGSDYLETMPGTFFDFGGPIGSVALRGRPISPSTLGTTDTIVQRQADALLPVVGSMAMIPIELVALSLESVMPVEITPGSFFDVYVTLTPLTHSSGSMVIRHEGPDNGGPGPEGTFDSFFDVFFTADFTEVGNPFNTFSISDHLQLSATGALWSHEPMLPGALLVTGPAGDQNANNHTGRPPLFGDDHVLQVLHIKVLGGPGAHVVGPATPIVPEPGTLVLSLGGLAACGLRAVRRKRALRPRRRLGNDG